MTAEKIEAFWENATADDVARVMAGETVEARFRDVETEPWTTPRTLTGWINQSWVSGLTWNFCQVYREPSWSTDKPDPGPGCRLLGKFPDEGLKPGDEYFDRSTTTWRCSTNAKAGMPQPEKVWYRRRIEPVEPEPRHYVLRVGDTVEWPSGDRIKCAEPGVEQRHYVLRATDTVGTPSGQTITITAKGFEVTQ
jgi:hypothetical protein